MNDAQRSAFELRLSDLRERAKTDHELTGCMLAACSAHNAGTKEQSAVIRFLAKSGVSVDETDKNGVTPLHRAVRFRSLSAVNSLLQLGAGVNAPDRRSRSTPLHRATTHTGAPATAGKNDIAVAIAKVLLEHGADAKLKNKKGKTAAEYAKRPAMKNVFE